MDDASVLLEARELSRRYGAMVAVDGVNLTLRKGEILGLLGPNGAGKTSTLKMLSGCLAPSSGEVRVGGVDMAEEPKAAKAHLGYLPEKPPVYGELTVDEYLRYSAGLRGVPARDRAGAVEQAKRACGLAEAGARLIGNLSTGFQQRVGLAQAIIHNPAVVILDEPTVGLDPIQIREIRALIKRLGESHSVILSSHILPEVQAVCDRVMIMHRGRVVYAETLAASAQTQLQAIVVRLRRAPVAETLARLPGVRNAQKLEDGSWRLALAEAADPREALAEAAVREGWGLLELRPESKTLEERFVELTSGDETLKEAA